MSFPREILLAAIAANCNQNIDLRNHHIGCVIRRKDGALVKARNVSSKNKDPSCHAEVRACRKSDVGSVAYVARVRRDGTLANARPCPSCQAILRARGVLRAYFTITNDEWGCLELDSN